MAPTIRYSDGSHVNGSWIFERIQIADAVVPRHKIQMATSVVNVGEDDGIMGLGFSSNPSTPTFWEDYIRTNPSASPVFSYYIDLTETHGFITFGGMDLNRFRGPLYWAQGTALQNAWALELNSLIVGTRSIPLGESSLKVKVDTGTSLANFPNDIANALNQALGIGYVTLANGKSVRGVPCPSGVKPSLPSFTMNFGNVPLEFTPNEYLYYQVGTRDQILCLSGFIGADRRGSAVLGNVLLRRFYTVFDQSSRKIGFAIANRHTGVAANLAGGSSRNSPLGLA